jgi:hypothetical protein
MNELQKTLVNRLLDELRSLNAALLGIQQEVRAIRDQQEAANERQQEQRQHTHILNTEPQIPEAIQRDKRASEKRHFTVQAIIAGSTFLAFVAAAVYAGINYKMLRQMRQSTKAAIEAADTAQKSLAQARDQFRQDQRPYIWATANLGSPERWEPTGQLVWDLHFTNYGKSPALEIRYYDYMRIGKGAMAPSFGEPIPHKGAPLPPGKDDFITVVSKPGVTADEYARLLHHPDTEYVEISGRFLYTDFYGGKYETAICLRKLKTGAVQYCSQATNYIK